MKLRPQTSLLGVSSRANLRPLFDAPATPAPGSFGLSAAAASWYVADLPELAPSPWDAAHAQVSSALGIDDSAVLFVEPDLPQKFQSSNESNPGGNAFAIKQPDCQFHDQDNDQRPPGPGFAWHLGDAYSQLATARNAVTFSDAGGRTRIAHIDTGYDSNQLARPAHILHNLERNFVNDDGTPNSASDPNRGFLFDNSGHGTGTIGILAGQAVAQNANQPLGGAPDADILPIRIANSVVLFFTSALAQAINYAVQQKCDVISLSMGGLPSEAWNDAVNAAYEAGVCIVAASGDCFNGLPTRHVVYPARYHRTIAACGVMANGTPYYDLPIKIIEGNWGPDSSMTAALAAYTPNTPWAKIGCPGVIDMNGAGTSSSTPQIAAAAALWYEKYKTQLPRDWRRVEAVRKALFDSARSVDPTHFGHGILRANDALANLPNLSLPKTPSDDDSFAFFRVITGLGITDALPRERMLNMELAQRYLMNPALQKEVPDPASQDAHSVPKAFFEALIADREASETLRRAAASRYLVLFGTSVPGAAMADLIPPGVASHLTASAEIALPPYRRLRTYAIDPSFSTRLETSALNRGLLSVRWEGLKPGPVGEYIEVADKDVDGTTYAPANLDDPRLLAQDGFAPAEGKPQFHQQMVYAVSMNTIAHFEAAMGRPVLWRPRINPKDQFDDSEYVQRLQIQPHAFRDENAFYDPVAVALRFGYFQAAANDPGDHVPGTKVFTCLSQDIVAHETTHAILDGMHRRFNEPTNPDVLAFHEGFADIVALMQHFTMHDLLSDQIGRSRGDLEGESVLGSLAIQFGRSSGGRGALREAIGSFDERGVWKRLVPDPAAYKTITTPHSRGALLVATIFDAFLAIYKSRTADLYRIYTGGTGVLKAGAIHPDLVQRLASEATKAAAHVLHICIRALDYIPPVDITFGEYLRGIITADFGLVPDDPHGYRVAFVEAFRRRGIYPGDLDTLSVDTLRWQGIDLSASRAHFSAILKRMKRFSDDCLYITDRKKLFLRTRKERRMLHQQIKGLLGKDQELGTVLGIDPTLKFQVHELRGAQRTGPDGRTHPQIVVAITQERQVQGSGVATPFTFSGGSTLIADLATAEVKYVIRKRIDQPDRERSTAAFIQQGLKNPLTALLLDPKRLDRFAVLHNLAGLRD